MKKFVPVFKRIYLFIIINFLFVDCSVLSQTLISRELNGFRGNDWGSSLAEVKSNETKNFLQSFQGFGIDALSYKGDIAGLNARIDYSFKDGKLFEGTYIINPDNDTREIFKKLQEFLIDEYGKPNFRAGQSINSDSIWMKIDDYGKFKGPELFWKFNNGFIGLIASKYEEEVTVTVLYSNDKSIEEYGRDRLISTDDYK